MDRLFRLVIRLLMLVALIPLGLRNSPATAQESRCQPWQGDPIPLARVDDPDPERALLARLRAGELLMLVAGLEELRPKLAARIFRHVLCFDPDNAEAHGALVRLTGRAPSLAGGSEPRAAPRKPAAAPRPPAPPPRPVAAAPPPPPAPRPVAAAPPPPAPRPVAASPPPPPAPRPVAAAPPAAARSPQAQPAPSLAQLAAIDAQLAELDGAFWDAHFRDAWDGLAALDASLAELPEHAETRKRMTAAAILRGQLAVALGQREVAVASFRRAIENDASLELDPASTSRKVREVFDVARLADAEGDG